MKFLRFYNRVVNPILLCLSLNFMTVSSMIGSLIYDPSYWFEFASGFGHSFDVEYAFGFLLVGILPLFIFGVIDFIVCFIIRRHNAQKTSDQSDGSHAGQ